MRTGFINTLVDIARKDKDIFLLIGDVGFGVVEPFASRFPGRFRNVGVAEQNMAGIAAGLALTGKKVFIYSIANFPVFRCLEQIRNDICYHGLSVTVVTVGAGFAYGQCGSSHQGTEDIAAMRNLPDMTVIAPADPVEAALAVRAVHKRGGPCYLRLQRSGDPVVHKGKCAFAVGRSIKLREGENITLISTGGIMPNVLRAADILDRKSISARVLSMHTIKPVDGEAVVKAAAETGAVVTVEEHSITGGLGSAVAEVLMESGPAGIPFRRLGIGEGFCRDVGGQEYLRQRTGLSPEGIARSVRELLRRKRRGR